MKTFLIAVAGTVVGIVLIVLLIRWWIIRWFRKAFEPLADALAGIIPEPLTVSLSRANGLQPQHQPQFDALKAEVRALGFESAGDFVSDDLGHCMIAAFAKPSESVYAAICEIGTMKPWCDFVTPYDDGRTCTYCNLAETGADQPPWSTSVKMPGKSLAEVFDAFLKNRPTGVMTPVSAAAFQSVFESAYARTMEWRLVRGVSEDEVRRVASLSKVEVTEEVIKGTVDGRRYQRDSLISDLVTKEYRKFSKVSADDWEAWTDRIVVVHDTIMPDTPAETLLRATRRSAPVASSDEQLRQHDEARQERKRQFEAVLKSKPARAAFAELVRENLPGDQARVLYSLDKPVPADLWLLPNADSYS